MQRTLWLLTTLVLATACQPARQSPAPQTPPAGGAPVDGPVADASPKLPLDPAVRTGKLANGLTYYIRKHDKPKDRVALWLAVDAGSVLEDDDQQGLAHFVEHMAFNGTARFEKNKMIDFFEQSGMDFGADVNAYTSFDETVYMLQVPSDDSKLVATGLDVLEDWAGAVGFDGGEVDKERGVVIEEWRLRRGAFQRVRDQQLPILLAGSKYADRQPIGKKEILEKAPRDTLKRFYTDWYRPDLMAVIVVGNVDPDAMQKEIEGRFGDLKAPAKPRDRASVPVPLTDETRVAVFGDPEMSQTSVSMSIKGPLSKLETEADWRRHSIEDLFHAMLRARFDEIRRKPDAPITFAFSNTSPFGRAVDVFSLDAGVKGGQISEALAVLLVEVERVRRHGFVAGELERAKAETLRRLERAAVEAATVDGRQYARQLVRHQHDDRAMPGPDKSLELGKKFLPDITLAEVNALAGDWTKRQDRVVVASGPSRDKLPEVDALKAVVAGIEKLEVTPYEDKAAGDLLAQMPKPGAIAEKAEIPEIGVTVWTLSNGAKVVLKPTDFKNDEVLFSAFSNGGHSLANDKRWESANRAADIVVNSGVGEHDPTALRKVLAGKVASMRPYIDELEEGLRGNASPRDLETMLQLAHLYFTAPRKDEAAFAAWKASETESIKNRDLNPQFSFFEAFGAFSAQGHKRRKPASLERLAKIDQDQALEFYRERFADASDFTFVFVGNIDPAKLEPMVATYLASLPATRRKESWKDIGVRPPGGVKKFRMAKGQDPKSFVTLTFHGDAKWTPEAEHDLEMAESILDIRLREVLREEMSGVYGVFANGSLQRRPKQRYTVSIGFGCAPENAERLQKAVFDVVAAIKKDGIGEAEVTKLKEQTRRKLETRMRENGFWSEQLGRHYRYATDPKAILELAKRIDRIDAAAVQKALKRFVEPKRHLEGLLVPAAEANASAKPATAAAATAAPSGGTR